MADKSRKTKRKTPIRRNGGGGIRNLLILVVVLGAIGAALAWTFRYGDLRRLYFQTKCEHGYMLVQGRGYCLDENRNPIIERDAQGRIVYD